MIDTHTHILPGVDDGAKDLQISLQMLRQSKEQGVEAVVLTPHFYPTRETVDSFLSRRAEAFEQLQAAVTPDLPRLILGAEVAWCAGLEKMPELRQLTMGDSDYLLLEMPHTEWSKYHLDGVWNLADAGRVIPVFAHVERFIPLQKDGQFRALARMQLPMQISADVFDKPFGGFKARRLMAKGQWMIGSDCHNLTSRPPCMAQAQRYLQTRAPALVSALNWEFD